MPETWPCICSNKTNLMLKSRLLFLSCYMLFFAYTMSAQTAESRLILDRFEENFRKLDSIILGHSLPDREGRPVLSVRTAEGQPVVTGTLTTEVDSALKARSLAKLGELAATTGLKFTGQTYYRLDEGLGIDDDDAVSGYKGKVQAEVRWDFFHSGLYNRKGRAGEVALEEEIDRRKYMRESNDRLITGRKEEAQAVYDKAVAGVLLHHIDNLTMLSDAQEYLLGNENISSDQLLTILNEKAESERQLATLSIPPSGYVRAADLSAPENTTIQIDTLRLFEEIRRSNIDTETLRLRMKMLDLQAKNTTYWSTTSISPFVRYSYYVRNDLPNSSNVDAGLSFTLPLSAETGRKRRTMKAERGLLEAEADNLKDRITERARLIVADIERMNRAAEGELQRLKDVKRYISMRVNAYNNRRGGYNLLARAKEYNNYFTCWEKLLEFQYRRENLLTDLQTMLPVTPVEKFIKNKSKR